MDILQDLTARGLIHQCTDMDGINKLLKDGPITLYAGFDPTADSLHIGHLLPIIILRRFQLAGHKPLALVGGGTGLIGDPSGRSTERSLNDHHTVMEYTERIKQQLSQLLDFETDPHPALMVNNYDWLASLNVIEFLRDIGKNFTVNYMLAKDSVDSRMAKGISFTEFSYMILQSYDFQQLYQQHHCKLQIGGSDQWGNITAGIELIGRTAGNQAYGITIPLITKSDGTKFGKTAGGAVWLDPKKTTPYEFYQFWLNTDDQDVIRFLNYFTFLTKEEITSLADDVSQNPGERKAQRVLASELTELVHGNVALHSAIRISKALFDGNVQELSVVEMTEALHDVPSTQLPAEEIGLVDLLVASQASSSKRQAREDIGNGAIYLNGQRTTDLNQVITETDRLHNQYVIIRRGKKNYFLVKFSVY